MTASAPTVRVWDAPTRVFHWLFAAAFCVAWLTGGEDRWLDLHLFAGYAFLGLLAFRLLWGVVGGRYARFQAFRFPARTAWEYLCATCRGTAARHLGHNPAGSLAIWALFVLGLAVSAGGLIAYGGEERHGPLAGLIGFGAGEAAHELHELVAVTMLLVVSVHVAGVVFESWRHRENLVLSMITGKKTGTGPSSRRHAGVAAAIAVTLLTAGAVQFRGYATATPAQPYIPFAGPVLTQSMAWNGECGGCHLAYHPALLPARSWDAVFRTQHDHFGDDLALSDETVAELVRFARAHAAESAPTEAAWKIARSVSAQETPRRITETRYWQRKHRDIPPALWERVPVRTRANCPACHLDAERGTFEDGAMRLPNVENF